MRVPLKQTREELRQLRERLDDPNFIYERAKGLGLAEEDRATETPVSSEPITSQQIQKIARDQVEIEKTYEKYPELREDEELRFMVAGLINRGNSPLQAADKAFAKIKAANKKAADTAAEAEKQASKKQDAAQTVSSTSSETSDDAEMDRLVNKSHDKFDSSGATQAMIELEKLKLTRGQK
ncbi:MAG: hypothetical protein ACTSUP_01660 [Candidatus Heimdallarchaeaceae archaeon]